MLGMLGIITISQTILHLHVHMDLIALAQDFMYTHPGGSSSHAIVYIAEYVRYLRMWGELCIGFNLHKVTDCPSFDYLF